MTQFKENLSIAVAAFYRLGSILPDQVKAFDGILGQIRLNHPRAEILISQEDDVITIRGDESPLPDTSAGQVLVKVSQFNNTVLSRTWEDIAPIEGAA